MYEYGGMFIDGPNYCGMYSVRMDNGDKFAADTLDGIARTIADNLTAENIAAVLPPSWVSTFVDLKAALDYHYPLPYGHDDNQDDDEITAETEALAESLWRNSHMAKNGVKFANEDRAYFIRLAQENSR